MSQEYQSKTLLNTINFGVLKDRSKRIAKLGCAVRMVGGNAHITANNVKKTSCSFMGAPVSKTSHSRSWRPLTSKELTEICNAIRNKIKERLSKIINPTKSKSHKGSPAKISSTKSSTPAQSKARKVSGTGILPFKTRKPAQSTPLGGSQVGILPVKTRKTVRRRTHGSSHSVVTPIPKARKFGRHWRPIPRSTVKVAPRIGSSTKLPIFAP